MKNFFLFLFVVYVQNLFGSIILVNKIDPSKGYFKILVNYKEDFCYSWINLEYDQTISFNVIESIVNHNEKPVRSISIHLTEDPQYLDLNKPTLRLFEFFFVEACNKLKNQNNSLRELEKWMMLKTDNFYQGDEDKIYHILIENLYGSPSSIVLKEQPSQLADAAAGSCVIL